MKKYKLTKITVKTREIISVPGAAAVENQTPACPVCHAPLKTIPFSTDGNSSAEQTARPTIELNAGEISRCADSAVGAIELSNEISSHKVKGENKNENV